MAGAGRRMPPHRLGGIERTNQMLHGEGMDGSERIFEVPLVSDEFRIQIRLAKVLHIRITTVHAFTVK